MEVMVFVLAIQLRFKVMAAGDGAGDARVTIQQVCEDVNQLVMSPSGSMDTYRVLGAFPPMLPQDQIRS